MLETLIVWIWLFLFSYTFGETIVILVHRDGWRENKAIFLPILMGLTFMTIYAQCFSLLHPVDEWAILCLAVLFLVAISFLGKHLIQKLQFQINRIKRLGRLQKVVGAITLLMLLAYLLIMSVRPVTHYDTYLYQAQAVHWLEDYGCVKGIANVSSRLGFNSSIFSLYALFSMKWLFGHSLHAVNGFLAMMLAAAAVDGLICFKSHSYHMADAVRGLSLIYVVSNWNFINSLATDFPNMVLTAAVLILWIDMLENQSRDFLTYALLCLMIIEIVTIKFSSLFLLILAYVPFKQLVRKENRKRLLQFAVLSIGIVLPFLLRNYFVSGWLLYPFAGLDLFDVVWKLPKEQVAEEANWVYSWARIPWASFEETLQGHFMSWFPTWWGNQQPITRRNLIWIAILLPCVLVMYWKNRKKTSLRYANLLVMLAASVLYWIVTAPDVRFSWIYIMLLPYACILFIAYDIKSLHIGSAADKALIYCLGICLLMQGFTFFGNHNLKEVWSGAVSEVASNKGLLIYEQDYAKRDLKTYSANGVDITYPADGDQTGYYGIPGATNAEKAKRVALLGNVLEDGFKTLD